MPESFRSQDAATDIEMIRWGRSAYTTDGTMPEGGPEAVKHFLDATIDKVRDSKIDLAATWTRRRSVCMTRLITHFNRSAEIDSRERGCIY
jgi:hypothetical protein